MDRTEVLLAVTASAALWFIFTLIAGFLSDSLGRKNDLPHRLSAA